MASEDDSWRMNEMKMSPSRIQFPTLYINNSSLGDVLVRTCLRLGLVMARCSLDMIDIIVESDSGNRLYERHTLGSMLHD